MAKKKSRPKSKPKIDAANHGVDLKGVLESMRPALAELGTAVAIGEAAGIAANSVRIMLRGETTPSIGALAAMAEAVGGRIVVKYEPRVVKYEPRVLKRSKKKKSRQG